MTQEAFPNMVVYTPDDLNPKGQTAKSMEMSIRRSVQLSAMCRTILDQTGTMEVAAVTPPWAHGNITSSKIKQVFGDDYAARRVYAEWWPWIMRHWYTGAMERCERLMMLNLPRSTQEKLNERHQGPPT